MDSSSGRIAAYRSWANTVDRSARTAPARRAADARFEAAVRHAHPEASDTEVVAMADAARKAWYIELARRSAAARRRRPAAN